VKNALYYVTWTGINQILERWNVGYNKKEEVKSMQGKVKFFDAKKGYGFITRDDNGQDVFVHYSDIVDTGGYRTLDEAQSVKFEVETSNRGDKAVNVEKL